MDLAADGATGAVERGAALSSTGVLWIESMAILVPVFAVVSLSATETAVRLDFREPNDWGPSSARQSGRRCLFHNLHNRVFYFLCHPFKLWRIEHRQESGWLQSGQNRFAA